VGIGAKGRFQTDDRKIAKQNWDNYNPAFNQMVEKDKASQTKFEKNIDKWSVLISFFRFYPDLMIDMLRPESGSINLHLDQRVYLRAVVRFYSTYGVLPRGWGKCVTSDTILFTDKGLVRIGDFFDNQYDNVETIRETNFNIVDRYGNIEKTNLGIYSGYKETIKIKTEYGFHVEGTTNHPLLVKDQNGGVKFKPLSEINIGEYVCVSTFNDLWGGYKGISEEAAFYLGEIFRIVESYLIKEENKDCSNGDIKKFITSLTPTFLEDNKQRETCESFVEATMRYLELLSSADYNLDKINVPPSVLCSPKSVVCSFVKGLLKDEDFVEKGNLCYKTKSEAFANQLHLIFLNLGYLTSLEHIDNGYIISWAENWLSDLYYDENQFSNYHCVKVLTKEFSKGHVYDIHVPNSHSFVANGIVNHNTFLEVLASFCIAMLFPGAQLALTAQTKQNAAELLKAKYNEITGFYPLLKNEVIAPRFSKDDATVPFVNGSQIDILSNTQSSKGQRRHRINIEESALLDNALFEDALEPIVEVGRTTKGTIGITNPQELNQQINFFTTSGFRATDEFVRNIKMVQGMRDLKGEFVIGADWMLACWFGRGSTKQQMLNRKKRMSAISFAQNYMSDWVGASESQLVDINKLFKCRTLTQPEFYGESDCDYVLGIDVARSQKSSNNRTSVSALKILRNKNNSIREIHLVNLFVISNAMTFEGQAIEVKRLQRLFNAKACIMDCNGLGVGLKDECFKEQTDPKSGERLLAWNTINTEDSPETVESIDVLYDLKPQSAQTKVITDFMDVVESGKLRLLEKRNDSDFGVSEEGILEYAPFAQTEEVVGEISNLKIKHLPSGALSIEKVVNRVDKDRFSGLSYGIWWAMEFDNQINSEDTHTMGDYFRAINGSGVHTSSDFRNKYFI